MTPREFLNGWFGYDKAKKETWDVLFYIGKYNALRTAFSDKQQRQIMRDKAPWVRKKKTKEMSFKSIEATLNMISR